MRALSIPVRAIKVTVAMPASALPADVVPPEPAPAGEVPLNLVVEGSAQVVQAPLNGKSIRKALKVIAAEGVENVVLVVQGELAPPARPGGTLTIAKAGLTAQVKAPKPAETEPPAGGASQPGAAPTEHAQEGARPSRLGPRNSRENRGKTANRA